MESGKRKISIKNFGRIFNPTRFFIAIVLSSFITTSVSAQIITSAQIKTDVAKLLETKYQKSTQGDVEVKISATPFSELQLPDGKISYRISDANDRIAPRDIKRIDVLVNNIYVKTLNLPTQTSIYKEVLVANDFIDREQTVTKECTTLKKIDIALRANYVLTEDMLSKEMVTKKVFQKGEVLDKRFIKMKPDVARNSDVRIFFVSKGAVMITIEGTSLADGMIGDYINVQNKNYKKVYNGKIIGENKILVNL